MTGLLYFYPAGEQAFGIFSKPWHIPCTFGRVLLATHSLHFRVHTRVLITLLLVLAVTVAAIAGPEHRKLLTEAAAAQQAGDSAQFIAKLEAARTLRPDYPHVLLNLARGYAATGRADDALAQLRTLAGMGLALNVAADPAFVTLRDTPSFTELTAAFAANARPAAARDEAAWAVADVTGIIESVAIHPETLESFFGDVRNRCIWYRDVSGPHGVLKKFSADGDGLDGVFALKIDAARGTLWASCSALPAMAGYAESDKGRAFLAEYDLATRKLRGKHALPADDRRHVLGDFVLAADGTVYATDSASPVIWRLAPGGTRLERWLEHDDFVSLQGIAVSADGRTLHVADHANGLWHIDTATRTPGLLRAPAGSTLFGVDGLYPVPGGLVAVQNGVNPQRILRLDLDAAGAVTRVKVLLAGHAAMDDAALGQVVNGRLQFVANSDWALFEPPCAAPAPRNVVILSTATE